MLETNRFILREMMSADAEGLFELDSDPEVHRYLGGKPISTLQEARDVISFLQSQYEEHGIGRWAIVDKQTKLFVGWCGLKWNTSEINGHIHYYDLGYRIIRKYWRQGIASETAKACLSYAFNDLQTDRVYAIADCENIGSNAILNGLGMTCVESFFLDGALHNWYELKADQFKVR